MLLVATAISEPRVLAAGIGPASSVLETIAASVGAGLVLGGFVAGVAGLLMGVRPTRDQLSDAGYLGGLFALAIVLVDSASLIVR